MNIWQLYRMAAANRGLMDKAHPDGGDGGKGGEDDKGGDKGAGDKGGKGEGDGTTEAEAKLVKEVMAKKQRIADQSAEIESLKTKLEETSKTLKSFEGIDVDQVKKLIEADGERKKQKLKDASDWDALEKSLAESHENEKKQMAAAHQEALDKVKSESATSLEELTKKFNSASGQIEELTVGASFSNSQFVKDSLIPSATKIRKLYGEHFDVVEGSIVAFDKPRGSEARTKLVDAAGKPLSFNEALGKIVDSDPDKNTILRSKVKPGSGSRQSDGNKSGQGETEAKGVSRIEAALSAKT